MAESKSRFLSKEQENRAYISDKVNPLIEKMLIDLLKEKPQNSVFPFEIFSNNHKFLANFHDKLASN